MVDSAAVFRALGSERRLEILDALSLGPKSRAELISAIQGIGPALSQHLKVLAEVGIIRAHPGDDDGRRRVYSFDAAPFAVAKALLATLEVRARRAELLPDWAR